MANSKPVINNSKFKVVKYDAGWIVTRKADKFDIYFENYSDVLDFIK